jgi:hypothetical protein
MTILKFPDPHDFFDWLKKKSIHEYGSVVMIERKTTSHGIPLVTYTIKMSAKDISRAEIIQCELPFYNGILVDQAEEKKKAQEAEKTMKDYIEKVHKEAFKDYEISVIPAEFLSGEETT